MNEKSFAPRGPSATPGVIRLATREMVQTRARELALAAGRIAPHMSQEDYEQAKRELTGETDGDRQQAVLDSIPAATP